MKSPKIIYVKWLDHYSANDGWYSFEHKEFIDGIECSTVGFLIKETKKALFVSLNYGNDNKTSADTMCILKSCVLKRKYLATPK